MEQRRIETFLSFPPAKDEVKLQTQNRTYKSILNHLWQKDLTKTKPNYTVIEECSNGRVEYSAVLMFEGYQFHTSSPQPSKKGAEQNVAGIACRHLGLGMEGKDEKNVKFGETHTPPHDLEVSIQNQKEFSKNSMMERKMNVFAVEQPIEPMYFDFEKDDIEDYEIVRSKLLKGKDCSDLGDAKTEMPYLRKCYIEDIFDYGSGKTYKSLINELAQKHDYHMPAYRTKFNRGAQFQFYGEVSFCGKTYKSATACSNKKSAEHLAAKVCWGALQRPTELDSHLLIEEDHRKLCQLNVPTAFSNQESLLPKQVLQSGLEEKESDINDRINQNLGQNLSPKIEQDRSMLVENFKGLLDEHLMQRGLPQAVYSHRFVEGEVRITCNYENRQIQLHSPIQKRKNTEQEAAKQALKSLGIEDPSKVIRIRNGWLGINGKRKASSSESCAASKRPKRDEPKRPLSFSHHSAKNQEALERERRLLTDDSSDFDDEHDPLSVWGLGEPRISGLPVSALADFSICEEWPDKTNILIAGNSEFSIPLKCLGITKELICHKEDRRVRLRPGVNIRGLVCKYHLQGNDIYLRGKSCDEILLPEKPKPVLLSCGVTLIHVDRKLRDPVQVLLKRYVTSPAFIHVSATLAQWFRRYLSGRPMHLDINRTVQHIDFWSDSEVQLLSEMTGASIKQLFVQWNFKDSWSRVLQTHLPVDLRNLQSRCRLELQRRRSNKQISTDAYEKLWTLPKGTFKHRLLSTGVFLESSSECAYRELREETGIVIPPSKIERSPFVDIQILENENFNPHKGDFTRYFLCLNEAKTPHAGSCEGDFERAQRSRRNGYKVEHRSSMVKYYRRK